MQITKKKKKKNPKNKRVGPEFKHQYHKKKKKKRRKRERGCGDLKTSYSHKAPKIQSPPTSNSVTLMTKPYGDTWAFGDIQDPDSSK
jgi:hypothetical protein